jgi:hypothetical protein
MRPPGAIDSLNQQQLQTWMTVVLDGESRIMNAFLRFLGDTAESERLGPKLRAACFHAEALFNLVVLERAALSGQQVDIPPARQGRLSTAYECLERSIANLNTVTQWYEEAALPP